VPTFVVEGRRFCRAAAAAVVQPGAARSFRSTGRLTSNLYRNGVQTLRRSTNPADRNEEIHL
jgi:hypothetical protein